MELNSALDISQNCFHVLGITNMTHSYFHETNDMSEGNLKFFVKIGLDHGKTLSRSHHRPAGRLYLAKSLDVQDDNDFRSVKGLIIYPSDIFFDQLI